MDDEVKVLFGRILGEILRMQRLNGSQTYREPDYKIYGLINGIESVIDEYINPLVTNEQERILVETLNSYVDRPDDFEGYYTIENELRDRGFGDGLDARVAARDLFTKFKARGMFLNLIKKMDSDERTPDELRNIKDIDLERV